MDQVLIFFPLLCVLLWMYAWCIFNLRRGFQERFLWKEETVEVRKSIKNEIPIFTYTLEGSKVNSSRFSNHVQDGEAVTIIYPPGHPELAKEKSEQFRLNLPIAMSVVTLILSVFFWLSVYFLLLFPSANTTTPTTSRPKLVTTGIKIQIPSSKAWVQSEYSNELDGDMFRVKVNWTDTVTGNDYEFKSRRYVYDPTDSLPARKLIPIYLDPQDYSHYYMDLHFPPMVVRQKPADYKGVPGVDKGNKWITLGLGLLLAGVAAGLLFNTWNLARNGVSANATVVDWVGMHDSASGGYAYFPIVVFQTPNGETIRIQIPEGSSPRQYERGDQIMIYYKRGKPSSIITINTPMMIFAAVLGLVGLALLQGSIYFFMQ